MSAGEQWEMVMMMMTMVIKLKQQLETMRIQNLDLIQSCALWITLDVSFPCLSPGFLVQIICIGFKNCSLPTPNFFVRFKLSDFESVCVCVCVCVCVYIYIYI